MKSRVGGGPLRWCVEIGIGLYRSVLLVGLTIPLPAVVLFVGVGGSRFAYSWSAGLTSPVIVRVLAAMGETLMVAVWIGSASWIVLALTGTALAKAARHLAGRWLGLRIDVTYRVASPVTRMATGFWWDGHEYHKSEREARRGAAHDARLRDPRRHWDALWSAVGGVTVLPVAALPLLGLAGGGVLVAQPGLLGYGIAAIVAGLVCAPFAWRIFVSAVVPLTGPRPGQRVAALEAIQADMTQTQAAELERIERGLHDGAQARLVSMGMSVQAAEHLIDIDPVAAKAILAEARMSLVAALAELRSLVRGINPPVLTERGLVDAVRALALDAPVEVTVRAAVPTRPERPVESAVYFAVAELLVNVAKHAHASRATVELDYAARTLTATVTDDGIGGAVATADSGLGGIARRMAAFGGQLAIDSPAGGPTSITVAVPCALS
ncbi:MAG TPA: histidine kinase [Pseudonocardiaceae bacterium]|nr:histidine kinase [Pseudonocardiaceae bacterium]